MRHWCFAVCDCGQNKTACRCVAVVFLHYAWDGRLCLHPFNLGFLIALSRDREIPNLKVYPCRFATGTEGLFKIAICCSGAKRPSQIAI